jgi:Family of unknown function (DUF6152)
VTDLPSLGGSSPAEKDKVTTMRKTFQWVLVAMVLAAGNLSVALAHHSAAMFDFTKNTWVSGVVKDIRVINPHMSLTLVVSGDKGTKEVSFEGHSVNNFYREGWRPNMVNVGDKIQVRYNPRKDGVDGGFVNGFVTSGGREIAFHLPGDTSTEPPPATSEAVGSANGK